MKERKFFREALKQQGVGSRGLNLTPELKGLISKKAVRADSTLRVQGSTLKRQPKPWAHVYKGKQVPLEYFRTQPGVEPQTMAQLESNTMLENPHPR